MRVAFLTPYMPWPADTGGKLRSYHLVKGLAQQDEVDLYTFHHATPTDPGPLAKLCRSVESIHVQIKPGAFRAVPSLTSHLPRAVRYFQTEATLREVRAKLAAPYDLFVCDEIPISPYLWEIPGHEATPRLVNRQKIDHLHYAEMAQSRPAGVEKMLDWLDARRLRTFEYAEMPRFDAAVVCSPEDRIEALREATGNVETTHAQAAAGASQLPVEIIVNGADTTFYTPDRQPDPHPTVLMLGTMHYYPNIDAVKYYFGAMHDALRAAVPNLRVLIVGHNPPPEIEALADLPGVTVTGSVPDIRPWMARSWLQMVPLRLGGGTRLKIVESMAAGLPVVSTAVGAQGLAVRDGAEMLLADDPADFVRKVTALLNSPAERERMSANARLFVEANYSWQSLGERFATFCRDTVELQQSRLALRAITAPPLTRVASL